MKKVFTRFSAVLLIITLSFTSCVKDLDQSPYYGLNAESVYSDPANYIHVLAKCYAGLAISGNQGPAGSPDISGIDEGFSQYLRVLWNLQELTTDEAVCAWNDPGIPELHQMTWSSNNSFVVAMYNRIFFQVPLCNDFIRQSSDANMSDRGFSEADQATIRIYRNEARFLRALSYYHAIDLFGNVPFVTEADAPGAFLPNQIFRTDLFNYIESELKDIENLLPESKQNEYGRADKSAAWTLLAKLYLNAQVYTGTERNTDAVSYCNKVINSGAYSLDPVYQDLFLADNNFSPEIIFPITFDGLYTQTYGGTTFLVHAPVGGSMVAADFGINGGWAGYRTTSGYVSQCDTTDTLDQRQMFYTAGQNLEITSISTFTDGWGITKWKNITSEGEPGSDPTGNFVDTDFPLFRLADVYLMYAEAVTRGGGGGDNGTAITLVNQIIDRGHGGISSPEWDVTTLDADRVLTERARELYWEGHRRTDLIRYGLFTGGTYIWPFKGGVPEGISVPDYLNLFPLAFTDLVANPNLIQNPGY
ncbi:MAG: RagB/SusD family nutrient uptake outer membrane protein [Chitinophagales bacterium]